jgi:hypothetical protein
MKRKYYLLQVGLRAVIALPAMGGFASAQVVNGSGGVNMGNTGKISNLRPVPHADGVTWHWETSPLLQGFVIPAGQLTGLAADGSTVPYDDLIPLKVPKLSVVAGSPGAAPIGVGTFIDGEGLDTNKLVVEGQTHLKGQVIVDQPQGDISMGIYQ